jgi:hypothetical protein
MNYNELPMKPSDFVDFNVARARDLAFDAVQSLWRRRQSEGLTQIALAEFLGRDEGWVSRTLSSPGNWTLRTAAALVAGLCGELEINALALEDPPTVPANFDAYAEYHDVEITSTSDVNVFFKPTTVTESSSKTPDQNAFVRRPALGARG